MLLLTDKTHSPYLKILSMFMAFIFSFEGVGYCLRVPMGAGNSRASQAKKSVRIRAAFDGIIEEAQAKKLIGMPLMDEVAKSYNAMANVGSDFGYNPGEYLEERLDNARKILGDLFMKNAEHTGLSSLIDPGNVHPQEEINWLLALKVYFDWNGNKVDIIEWLRQYYAPLIAGGLHIRISSLYIESEELAEWVNSSNRNEKDKMIIKGIRKEQIRIPVIILQDKNSTRKIIPVLMMYSQQEEKSRVLARYSYRELAAGYTIHDSIRIHTIRGLNRTGDKSLPEIVSVLVHEIDHAIFMFTHDSELKQLGTRLVNIKMQMQGDASKAELEQLAEEHRTVIRSIESSRRYNNVGRSIASEGLAMTAASSFLEAQISSLVKHQLPKKKRSKVITGLRLINLHDALTDQFFFDMILYSAGHALVMSVMDETTMQELYFSDLLDREIAQDANLATSTLSFFVHTANVIIARRNQIARTQIPSYTLKKMKIAIETGFGSIFDTVYFFFKERFKEMLSNAFDTVENMNDEQIEKELELLRNQYPRQIKATESLGIDNKDKLQILLFQVAAIKEIDRLFEEMLPGGILPLQDSPKLSSNHHMSWINDYAQELIVDGSAGFKPGEVNAEQVIRSITAIGGTPIEEINKRAQRNSYAQTGFADDVLEQMVIDNETVGKLNVTHQQLAGLLSMAVEKLEDKPRVEFEYNNMTFKIECYSFGGSQWSIFVDRKNWNYEYELINITQGERLIFAPSQIAEISALGFYEARVVGGAKNDYGLDPIILWRVFNDKDYRVPEIGKDEILSRRALKIQKEEGWDSVTLYTLEQLKERYPFAVREVSGPIFDDKKFYVERSKEDSDKPNYYEVRMIGPWMVIMQLYCYNMEYVYEKTGGRISLAEFDYEIFKNNQPVCIIQGSGENLNLKDTLESLINPVITHTTIQGHEVWFYEGIKKQSKEDLFKLAIFVVLKNAMYPKLIQRILNFYVYQKGSLTLDKYDIWAKEYFDDESKKITLERQIEIILSVFSENTSISSPSIKMDTLNFRSPGPEDNLKNRMINMGI